jgi:tryptophan synthase alpha chain
MNRIKELFSSKKEGLLSVYFTAGYPGLNDTVPVLKALEKYGADMAEIGVPFSDPLADGPVIQKSSETALRNGMNLELLFRQLERIRESVSMPLLLMSYLNPVYRYGMDRFCKRCRETGIDGVILPDLPPEEYLARYKPFFDENGLAGIFLVTPETNVERILKIDQASGGFIYMVSSSATTGGSITENGKMLNYFRRIKELDLKNPRMIGFGISDNTSFKMASGYANGAIIGSAFIKALQSSGGDIDNTVNNFIRTIKDPS